MPSKATARSPVQRALGLPGNDLMLHVAVGTQATEGEEGEHQMLFDPLERLRRGDVWSLDRGCPASWLVQTLLQRGIDFGIRCDSTRGWGAARDFLRSGQAQCRGCLAPCDAGQARTWELDGPAQMRARLVRHVSARGRTRVLVTSLTQDVSTEGLADNRAALLHRVLLVSGGLAQGAHGGDSRFRTVGHTPSQTAPGPETPLTQSPILRSHANGHASGRLKFGGSRPHRDDKICQTGHRRGTQIVGTGAGCVNKCSGTPGKASWHTPCLCLLVHIPVFH